MIDGPRDEDRPDEDEGESDDIHPHHEPIDRLLRAVFGRPSEPVGKPGRYIELRDPKKGGMGVVYRARDVELGRDVAYKVMKDASGDAEEFRLWFAREAEITARLQYPGIVPVFGMVTDGSGRPAYAMSYIEGTTFRNLVRQPGVLRKRLSPFLDACRIVEHAHGKGFIHCDLSLKNLMLADEGTTHVVDWGLARHIDPDDISNRRSHWPSPNPDKIATRGFTAPSVLTGGPKTFVTDVYSLGAVLAALALGITPDGQPDLDGSGRKNVPRPIRNIIKAAMADRENGLYRNAGDLAADVQRFLEGEPVRADREPYHEMIGRSIRRHPARTTALISSILLLSVVSTSASLLSAARDRAARKDEELQRQAEEARSARREASWSEANAAMLRCESILSRNPAQVLIPLEMIEPFLKALTFVGKKPDLPNETIESLRYHAEAARQLKARNEARGREAAEPELREVIAILERLEREVPEPRSLRYHLAKSYYTLGTLQLNRVTNELGLPKYVWITYQTFAGKPPSQPEVEAALAKIDKAQELLPNSSPPPSEPDSLRELELDVWKVRGMALARLGRFTECLMAYENALSLADGPGKIAIQKLRTIFLKAAEVEQSHMPWSEPAHVDHAKAILMADYLVGQPGTSPEAIFNAACAFSLASLEKGASVEEKERRANRAIALLGQIEEKGYFRMAKKAGELSKDYALEPLRQRADYKVLAARVAKGG